MSRNIISVCLSIFFMVLLTTPTIVIMVDDSIDISFLFDSSEEEEKKGNKKNKNSEVLFFDFNENLIDLVSQEIKNNLEYRFKKYSKPHLNIISPPPDLHIL
ncbi:hypothetical protein Q4Q35_05935 [Flavivirga aquimarina]|uniref:Uncharacterized protein n=1 Tax=Flavivirga aquimarina TaxID=2027862 RepID=A0ABT8W8E4_9FLAO|nr:hypothetical protein [Flavivirga aquimarina]MDO5969339.1 hypothetical protein [Flavivirga aquimarina]